MKIETLKERIKKTEEKIIKINKTLDRHKAQLQKKAKVLIDQNINPENCDRYEHRRTNIYWDICAYDDKKEDIKNNEKKLREANLTLSKFKEQLEKQEAKESEVENLTPQALNDFLEDWKKRCFEYYMNLSNKLIALKEKNYNDYEITKDELNKLEKREYDRKKFAYIWVKRFSDDEIENILTNTLDEYKIKELKKNLYDHYIRKFIEGHFANDIRVVNEIVNDDGENLTINEKKLNKILDDDVKEKKSMFIDRIKEVIGEIKDFERLDIVGGELNGIAIGNKCNAKVETISAGGYNIQCYHYRVLVNAIKQ